MVTEASSPTPAIVAQQSELANHMVTPWQEPFAETAMPLGKWRRKLLSDPTTEPMQQTNSYGTNPHARHHFDHRAAPPPSSSISSTAAYCLFRGDSLSPHREPLTLPSASLAAPLASPFSSSVLPLALPRSSSAEALTPPMLASAAPVAFWATFSAADASVGGRTWS